ncbi:MAG: DUF1398 family protein [Thiolinea sp.]
MDKVQIQKIADATLASKMSFPEAVGGLLEAGVDYYHVDYVKQRKTFYGKDGLTAETQIHYMNLPKVAPELDAVALKAVILDSQVNHQAYEAFTQRAMQAGVVAYFAFLNGRRVVYWGRSGESHTEYFPD